MKYSKSEYIDMVYALGKCEKNCFLAARVYAATYPARRHPDAAAFERLKKRFDNTGSVEHCKRAVAKKAVNDENEFLVTASVIEDPHVSLRIISQRTDISKTAINRILQKNKFHPYKVKLHQQLMPADFESRLQFCQWANDKLIEENFFDFVMFSDEATFHKNGTVNRHNFHYYATENPNFLRAVDKQHKWSLNVWGAILGTHVIGPHFFDQHINGESYLNFLENDLLTLLENVPRNVIENLWVQHDGAPPHYSLRVRQFLNNQFPNRWIGRAGPVNWPPRSPDLTCLDFFLWGSIKNMVYKIPPTTREDMKLRIQNAFQQITPRMLRNVQGSFVKRIQLCIETNGAIFEHLL